MDKKSNRNLLAVIDLKNMAKDRKTNKSYTHTSTDVTPMKTSPSIGKADLQSFTSVLDSQMRNMKKRVMISIEGSNASTPVASALGAASPL